MIWISHTRLRVQRLLFIFLCFFMSHHNLSNNNCTQMINSYIIILSFLQKYLFTLGNEVKCKINSFFFLFSNN